MAVLIPAQGGSSAISNGQIINGVANFWQTSAPTTRVEGAALVAGDLWYNPGTGILGFWRSPYWLQTTTTVVNFPSTGALTGTAVTSGVTTAPYNLFWESLSGVGRMSTGTGGFLGLLEIHGRSTASGGSNQFTIFSENLNIAGIAPSGGLGMFSRTINYPVPTPINSSPSALSYTFSITGTNINVGVQLSARGRLIL